MNTEKIETDTSTFIGASFQSVEGDFIPLSALGCVEGFEDGDQIQKSYLNENGLIKMKVYEYWDGDGWADPDSSEVLDPDFAINTADKGFWFITADPENVSFTEVSPLAD